MKRGASKPAPKLTANDFETLRVLLAGSSRLEEIAEKLGISAAATRDRLKQVKRKGYAQTIKGGKTWSVTPEGVAALERPENAPRTIAVKPSTNLTEGKDTPTAPADSAALAALEVDEASKLEARRESWAGLQALEGWLQLMNVIPLPEFRAALRLVLALALLRNRAPTLSTMPWVGLYGATGTGKSTVALCARAIVGGHFFQVGTMTAGEAIGRRSSKPPYALEEAPRTIAGAVTDLDELAEARPEVQTALYALLQRTDALVTIEGRDFDNRAAIVATWNPNGQTVPLPVGALRRGLLLDATPHAKRLERAFSLEMIGTQIRAALLRHPEPWVNLADLPAPRPVSAEALREGNHALYNTLTRPSDHPLPALAGLAAAYAVLFRLEDSSALGEAVSDFATITATRAETMRPDWRETVTAYRARALLTQELETTPPDETPATAPAEIVRQDLDLTMRREHTRQRAENAREPLRKHWGKLEPGERELAAPILKALEKIGMGAPHAASETLEVLRVELDTLEKQAVSVAGLVAERINGAHRAALETNEQEKRALEDAKTKRRERLEKAKKLRGNVKTLRDAVLWRDSEAGSDRAKHRATMIRECYRVGWLRDVRPQVTDPPPAQGFLESLARGMQLIGNEIQRATVYTVDSKTGARVLDLNQWMTQRAAALEQEASRLEAGNDAPALSAPTQPRALNAPKDVWSI